LAAEDQPVFAADGQVPEVAFGVVVVDRDAWLFKENRQRCALRNEVAKRFA
jgi:hypothetical protein